MVDVVHAYAYCKEDISLIENYDKAVADTTQTWICHHILGEILTREQLIAHDFYYNVPSCMLKFVTKAEHTKLHSIGRHHSEESCKKIGEAHKGKKFTEEHRLKISESMKGNKNFLGRKHTSETKLKMSEAKKGKTWKVIDGKKVLLSKNVGLKYGK